MAAGPWLVTGASGFLGRHLLQQTQGLDPPRRVIALVRSQQEWDSMAWTRSLKGVETLDGGVTAPERWAADPRLSGIGGVIHLAALVRHRRQDAEEVYLVNVEGTRAMVRVAARYRCRMVFVSTSGTVACFREPEPSADEDSAYCEAEVAGWPYYDSKVKAEKEARKLAAELGVELVIVRPPVLLGPGDHRFRSSAHVSRFLDGKLPFLIRGGMHFADVRDAARALVRVMEREQVRPVYHLPGTICTIEEFYRMVAAAAGRDSVPRVIPYRPAFWASRASHALGLKLLPEPALIEMAAHYWAMHSKYSEAELGYRSRPGLETVAATVGWLNTQRRHA
jgi:Nucleoside-diphosphate-sugar epimerases